MLKRTIPVFFIMVFLLTAATVSAVTNTWNGSFNSYWHNNNNWSQGHIPLSSEDVVIPSGVIRYPNVDYYDDECNSLTINSGARVTISDQTLTVHNDITVSGTLQMNNTASRLYCNDITWSSGSSASMTGSATIYLTGNWQFSSGAEVFLDAGYVDFYGSSVSYIRARDDNSYFNNIRVHKSSSYVSNSGLSTNPLRVKNIYIYSNAGLKSVSTMSFEVRGFINNMGGYINLASGTVEFIGGASTNYFQAGDYFNNLKINTTSTITFDDPVEIKGNLTISSGTFNPNNNTITIGGNWTNNVGDAGFTEGTGTVIFNGSAHQYCSDETFYTLEVNKSAALRVNGSTVTCENFTWTAGAVDVLSGTFTVNDLTQNGIYGNWYINDGGTINLYQDSSQYVDLDGSLYIYGGNFNIYGGNGASYWPYATDGSITMSGGTLDFKDVGINFYNSSGHTLTENITGGTIRTVGSVYFNNPSFTPSGGTVELYGSVDKNIYQSAGSIYDLTINTAASTRGSQNRDFIYDRNGNKKYITRSNTATLTSDLSVSNDFTITSGTLDLNGNSLTVNHDMNIYGTLKMNDAADNLTVNHILDWKSGSADDITTGNITVNYVFKFDSGTTASLDTGSTLTMGGSTSYLINQQTGATVGNVNVNCSNLYFNTSYQDFHILGDCTVNAGSNVHLTTYTLIVDGTFAIPNTSTVSVATGSLTNNSDMNLDGTLELTDDGTIDINGAFDIASTGSLNISNGTFTESGSYICYIYGNLTMSGGVFNASETLRFQSGSTSSVSGGEIDSYVFLAPYAGSFQPTGGKVKITPNGTASLNCDNGNYFYDFEIDSSAHGAQLTSNVDVHHDLTITAGFLKLNSHSLHVYNNMDIYGTLTMDNSSDLLTVDSWLRWYSGSSDDITDGTIYSTIFKYYSGTNASLPAGVTLIMQGTNSYIVNQDTDAKLGDVIADGTNLQFTTTTDTIHIVGDFAVLAGTQVNINQFDMIVDGTIDVHNSSTVSVTIGSLENNSDLNLTGSLELTNNGTIDINGAFDLASSGSLTINDGNFSALGSFINDIYGSFTMSGGTYQVTESCFIENTATTSISGGTITADTFVATGSSNFQPTGGTVRLVLSGGSAGITCNNGNYFYDLETEGSYQLEDNLLVNHSLTITSGYLYLNTYTLNVNNDMDVYGELRMTNASDDLSVYDMLTFKNGSTSDITAGNILTRVLEAESSTNANFGQNTNLTIDGSSTGAHGFLIVRPQSFTLGNVTVQNTNGNQLFGIADTLQVLGNFTVISGKTFIFNSNKMRVHGTIDVQNTGTMTVGDGVLVNDSAFNLNGTLSLAGGDINIWDAFDIASTGSLDISGGTFAENGSFICDIYGNLSMSGGIFNATETLKFQSGSTSSVSGGEIVSYTFLAPYAGSFQPTGGKVKITPRGTASINCDNGNYFYDFEIDSSGYGAQLQTDVDVHNDLTLTAGFLYLNSHALNVSGDMDIYSELRMTNASANLSIYNMLTFKDGSTSDITAGNILTRVLEAESSTNANFGQNTNLTIDGSSTGAHGFLIVRPQSFTLGNVTVQNTNGNQLFGITDTLQVLGNFTVTSGNTLIFNSDKMRVHGTIDVQNTGTMSVGDGVLVNDSAFNLNGTLSLNGGEVNIADAFDIASTGNLIIADGTFTENGSYVCDIDGNLTMSGGAFNATESLRFNSGATSTISGGNLTCTVFMADYAGNFQPTGGTVTLNPNGTASIKCDNGNYLYNLTINSLYHGAQLQTDVDVHNDLTITSGFLNLNSHTLTVAKDVIIYGALGMSNATDILNAGTDNNDIFVWASGSTANVSNGVINVYGDWTFADNCDATFTGGNVNFVGNTDTQITNSEDTNSSFYDVTIAKNSSNMVTINQTATGENLNVARSVTINSGTLYVQNDGLEVANDVTVNADELRLNSSTILKVGSSLNINNTATLNAIATSGNELTITSATPTGYYDFLINAGGTISAEYAIFERMASDGVYIKAGGALDPSYPLNYCTFRDAENSLIRFANNQTVTINGAQFIAGSSKNASYNVKKVVNGGRITFTNATGSFAGPDYELDSYDRIDWNGYGPDLEIIDVTYSTTNPYLADVVTATVTIKNSGNAKLPSTDDFYVDFFNNPGSAPSIGDIGDEYIEITGTEIAKNDTIQRTIQFSNNTVETWGSYLLIDSDETVTEIDETNNSYGPDTITWNALPAVSNLTITKDGNDFKLAWDFSISADSYKIYRTTTPNDFSGATTYTSTIKRYTDTGATSADKYFYVVTAVRNYPPSKARAYIVTPKVRRQRRKLTR